MYFIIIYNVIICSIICECYGTCLFFSVYHDVSSSMYLDASVFFMPVWLLWRTLCIHVRLCAGVQVCRCAGVQVCAIRGRNRFSMYGKTDVVLFYINNITITMHACVRVRACVCACEHACVHARVRAHACGRACVRACVRACGPTWISNYFCAKKCKQTSKIEACLNFIA